ncbi:MAG: DAK2 domain-containing protein [Lachnospiraceae bacterium]|nr:DAK2 domain-containing protein [Lachnospiraceae bacterium]
MSATTLDAKAVARMLLAGASELNSQKDRINELNVFPVPDGDTGTNMTLTIMSAAKEVLALGSDYDMPSLCKAISMGSLRGARGNSGVILSQLLRGLTKEIKDHETIDAPVIAEAFNKACETAYKAVMKPKEGTILTVAKGIAEKASQTCESAADLEDFIGGIVKHADEVLQTTPDLLPVLKQAGVVDSGGQGLLAVLTGAYNELLGKAGEFDPDSLSGGKSKETGINRDAVANAEIKFGYCTEFIILLDRVFNAKNEKDFKAYLESIGDSIVCVAMDEVVKVHVHTNHPGLAFEKALTFGSLTSMKIDNMREEHTERLFRLDEGRYVERDPSELDLSGPAGTANGPIPTGSKKDAAKTLIPEDAGNGAGERKKDGFIAVSVGAGLDEIFKGLGADEIISGGQTMNPSTEDMINAIEKVNADNIFIFPNNKNIILAANQASELIDDKNIIVIPTKTVPQGITAMINYMPDLSPEDNAKNMKEEIGKVRSGEVTYSVRDTKIDDKDIRSGDIMGIGDSSILAVGRDVEKVTIEMTESLITEDDSLVSIYYGEDVEEKDAGELLNKLSKRYPDLEFEIHQGGQPIYYYIISVE